MKMNQLEKLAMNNPVRTLIQRHFEAPLLERLGGRLEGLEVLEVGCGRRSRLRSVPWAKISNCRLFSG